MSTINNYWKIYCNTEQRFVYEWRTDLDGPPTSCPVNITTEDEIDTAQNQIIESRNLTEFYVNQEKTKTGGNYRWSTQSFTAAPNTTTTHIFSYPYNISVLDAMYQSAEENRGDTMTWIIAPNTTIGAITSNVTIGDTVLNVSSTVTANIKVGFGCNLFDGVNTDDLGYVLNVDSINGQITVENAATMNFSAATPTYVRMGVYFCKDITFGHPTRMQIGDSKILSSFVPANTIVHALYTNNSGTSKELVYNIEFMY